MERKKNSNDVCRIESIPSKYIYKVYEYSRYIYTLMLGNIFAWARTILDKKILFLFYNIFFVSFLSGQQDIAWNDVKNLYKGCLFVNKTLDWPCLMFQKVFTLFEGYFLCCYVYVSFTSSSIYFLKSVCTWSNLLRKEFLCDSQDLITGQTTSHSDELFFD